VVGGMWQARQIPQPEYSNKFFDVVGDRNHILFPTPKNKTTFVTRIVLPA